MIKKLIYIILIFTLANQAISQNNCSFGNISIYSINCNIENMCVDVDVIGGTSPYFFFWSNGDTLNNICGLNVGEYSLTVTDSNNCFIDTTINILAPKTPYVYLTPRDTICSDQPIILNAGSIENDNTYLWSDGSSDSTLTVNTSGQYWVSVTNIYGCVGVDTVNISIFPPISIDLGTDIEFCEGESKIITVENTFESYLWSTGDTLPSITVYNTDTISIIVKDYNSCIAKDTIIVYKHIVIEPFLGNDTIICEGESLLLSPEHLYEEYFWQDATTNSQLFVNQQGYYSVTVTDTSGCKKSSGIKVLYTENPIIETVITGVGIAEIYVKGGIRPYKYSHNNITYWQKSNFFSGLNQGNYIFMVKDAYSCYDEISIDIDNELKIPSFFTPNGDGYNDYWEIYGIAFFPDAEITIFDRFGKKLAEFNGHNLRWDGIYAGRDLPSDTYWYVIILKPDSDPIRGSVTLRR